MSNDGHSPSPSRLIAQFGECDFGEKTREVRIVEAIAADRFDRPVVDAALAQQQRIGEQIVGAEKVATHADRPGRSDVERQALLDLVQRVEQVAALAGKLPTKVIDRHVAQAADLEKLASPLPRCPLGAIGGGLQYHHGAVDRSQCAVGVLAKIPVG